jgi:hypothetical protein
MQILNHIWKNTQRSTTKIKRRGDRFHKNQKSSMQRRVQGEGRRKEVETGHNWEGGLMWGIKLRQQSYLERRTMVGG